MAEKSSTALKEVEEQLTCNVCLDQYDNPKTLPCLHSFCLQCIEKLPQEIEHGNKYLINCPSCRKPAQLPDVGPTEFPTPFYINNLFQLQNTLKKAFEGPKVSCDNCHKNSASCYCIDCTQFLCPECLVKHNGWQSFSKHKIISAQDAVNTSKLLPSNEDGDTKCNDHNKPLAVYCETCASFICHDCTVSKRHRNHDYNPITESYPKHHQEIEANLTKVKTKVADIKLAVTNLSLHKREIIEHGKDVRKEIHTQAELIINLAQQSERRLIHELDTAEQQKVQLLNKQLEEAETILNQMEGCEKFVEQSLKLGTQQQIMREKQTMVQVMTTVDQDVNPVVFQPIEENNITFTRNQTLVEGIGKLKAKTFAKSHLVNHTCYIALKSITTLNLQCHDGSPFLVHPSLISCELSSVDNTQPITCDVNNTKPGTYDISFIPHTEGKHQLKIRLGGTDISNDSFDLFSKMRGKPVKITPGINKPWGIVANDNGEIVVAENGLHRISILNKEGEMRSFGVNGTKRGQFTNPRGITLSHDGHLLVTDDHRLQKLKFDGSCVKSVGGGEKGTRSLQFNQPRGVTVHRTTGQIFIADRSNNRIQVLNGDLKYLHSFGKQGSAQEQLNHPHDVTFDNEGCLYVVDSGNNCIKKFTSEGKYISKFGSDKLKDPTSVIVQHNLIYVSESRKNRISAFDINNRQFVHCFGKKGNGEEEFDGPQCITVTSLGHLHVSDTWNNRMVVI